jgi:hypothetical protein
MQMLIVAQLVNRFFAFHGTGTFVTALSWASWIQYIPRHSKHFRSISVFFFQSPPNLPKWYLTFSFRTTILYAYAYNMPRPFNLPKLHRFKILGVYLIIRFKIITYSYFTVVLKGVSFHLTSPGANNFLHSRKSWRCRSLT